MLAGWIRQRRSRATTGAGIERPHVVSRGAPAIVRASLKKGVTVNAVANLCRVKASQVHVWRKQARQAAHQA